MGKQSMRENKNIYQLCREAQGLTRENASKKMIGVSAPRIEKIASLNEINPLTGRLIQISRDGKITDDEIQDFAFISKKLDEVSLSVSYQPYISKIKLDKRHFSGTPLRVISRRGEFSYNITSHKFPQENNIIYFLNGIEKIFPLLNRILLADIGCQHLIFKFCNLTTRLFNLKTM